MSEVLVTGAAGRVGQQLLPGLRQRCDLRLMDRTPVADADGGARVLVGDATIAELGYQPERHDVPEPAEAPPTTCSGPGQAPA